MYLSSKNVFEESFSFLQTLALAFLAAGVKKKIPDSQANND